MRLQKLRRALLVINIFLICAFLASFVILRKSNRPRPKPSFSRLILVWSSYFAMWGNEAEKYFPKEKLLLEGCTLTFDRSQVGEADAFLFHFWPDDMNPSYMDVPSGPRKREQVWVLMGQESPCQTPKELSPLNGLFNWTMTYRLDSEVEHGYGRAIPAEMSPFQVEEEITEILGKKIDLVLGVVSRCHTFSKRELVIDELKQFIPVEILGDCGKPIPKRDLGPAEEKFWQEHGSRYKFYLAFENALCLDYVTEKFWRSLKYGMVPVVYGGANYSHVAPPNSYINVKDFSSTSLLGEYLKMLDKNPVEYGKYFKWRKHFRVESEEGSGFQQLCKKLKLLKSGGMMQPQTMIMRNLTGWWGNACVSCNAPHYSPSISILRKIIKLITIT